MLFTLWGREKVFSSQSVWVLHANATGNTDNGGKKDVSRGFFSGCLFICRSIIIRDNSETPTWLYIIMRLQTAMNTGPLHYLWHVVAAPSRFSQIALHVAATLLNSTNNVTAVQTLLGGDLSPKGILPCIFIPNAAVYIVLVWKMVLLTSHVHGGYKALNKNVSSVSIPYNYENILVLWLEYNKSMHFIVL